MHFTLRIAVAATLGASQQAVAVSTGVSTETIVQSITADAQTILSTSGGIVFAQTPKFGGEFDEFDSALGSLQEVEIRLESQWAIFGVAGLQFGGVSVGVWGGIGWKDGVYGEAYRTASVGVIPLTPFHKPFDIDLTLFPPVQEFVGQGAAMLQFPVSDPVYDNYDLAASTTGGNLGVESLTLELIYRYAPIPEPSTGALVGMAYFVVVAKRRRDG
jgi:hypothetical protein